MYEINQFYVKVLSYLYKYSFSYKNKYQYRVHFLYLLLLGYSMFIALELKTT